MHDFAGAVTAAIQATCPRLSRGTFGFPSAFRHRHGYQRWNPPKSISRGLLNGGRCRGGVYGETPKRLLARKEFLIAGRAMLARMVSPVPLPVYPIVGRRPL